MSSKQFGDTFHMCEMLHAALRQPQLLSVQSPFCHCDKIAEKNKGRERIILVRGFGGLSP